MKRKPLLLLSIISLSLLGGVALTKGGLHLINAEDEPTNYQLKFTYLDLVEDMYEVDGNDGLGYLSKKVNTSNDTLDIEITFYADINASFATNSHIFSFNSTNYGNYSTGYFRLSFTLSSMLYEVDDVILGGYLNGDNVTKLKTKTYVSSDDEITLKEDGSFLVDIYFDRLDSCYLDTITIDYQC